MANDFPLTDNHQGALFSNDREYRYKLWREWDVEKPTVAFIMLNPSTADETTLDRTCRRCKGYAQDWGFGKLLVGNIFALQSTDPDGLYDHPDPVGPENDRHIREIADEAEFVVAAWGHHGDLGNRGHEVAWQLDALPTCDLRALGVTKAGHPKHPLYLPAAADPEPFEPDF